MSDKAQDPILGELISASKFKDLVYLVIDLHGEKDAVKAFGVWNALAPVHAIRGNVDPVPGARTYL